MTPLDAMRSALEALESVLCDPEGLVVIRGSDADRAVAQHGLHYLRTAISELESSEPVAYAVINGDKVVQLSVTQDPFYPHSTPLFTHPAQSRDSIIEECIATYSPDDSAQDWMDKLRALKGK